MTVEMDKDTDMDMDEDVDVGVSDLPFVWDVTGAQAAVLLMAAI